MSEEDKIKEKLTLFSTGHPSIALNNANKYFDINEKEENIIASHMFPISKKIPKYTESWIVSIVDKFYSIGEFSKKIAGKLSYGAGLYLMFVLNILK